jgi:hypothetical protein
LITRRSDVTSDSPSTIPRRASCSRIATLEGGESCAGYVRALLMARTADLTASRVTVPIFAELLIVRLLAGACDRA